MRLPTGILIGPTLCALALGVGGCRGREGTGTGARPVDAGLLPDMDRLVYPLTDGPPDALVVRLCAALHGTRTARGTGCCAAAREAPRDGGAAGAPARADEAAAGGRDPGAAAPGGTLASDEQVRCEKVLGAARRGG